MANYRWYTNTFISWYEHRKDLFYSQYHGCWWPGDTGHQHPWCWFIDLANWDDYPRTSRVQVKCWKCIRSAAKFGVKPLFKTLICRILKGNCHNISRFFIYVGIFAWLAEVIWYYMLSHCYCWMSCLIVLLLILLICYASMSFSSLSMYSWSALCCFWTIQKIIAMKFDTNVDLFIHWNSFEMWIWTKCPTFYRLQSVKCWPFCSGSHCVNCLHKSRQHWHARSNTRPTKWTRTNRKYIRDIWDIVLNFALLFTCICYMRLFHMVLWYKICRQSW